MSNKGHCCITVAAISFKSLSDTLMQMTLFSGIWVLLMLCILFK